MSTSKGVLKSKHFLGRLFINHSTLKSSYSVILARSVRLGKNSLSNPLEFSLVPLCQAQYATAK